MANHWGGTKGKRIGLNLLFDCVWEKDIEPSSSPVQDALCIHVYVCLPACLSVCLSIRPEYLWKRLLGKSEREKKKQTLWNYNHRVSGKTKASEPKERDSTPRRRERDLFRGTLRGQRARVTDKGLK